MYQVCETQLMMAAGKQELVIGLLAVHMRVFFPYLCFWLATCASGVYVIGLLVAIQG